MHISRFLLVASLFISTHAFATTAEEVKAIAIGETDARVEALGKAMLTADDKTAAFLQALSDDAVKVAGGKVWVVRDGKGSDPVTGADVALPADLEDVINNNRMRGEIDSALAALKLFSKDDTVRQAAV
jgi:urea transport system permease protein